MVRSPYTSISIGAQSAHQSKIFVDIIHKHINLEPICLKIIDTFQYQRLHKLKQLGTCDFVFRGATHTRLEHSLGVAYLAERLARSLKINQPHLDITDSDILCVKIAGLCHDLGHGPFSHVFDGVFMKRMRKKMGNCHDEWKHEEGSVQMFRYILTENAITLSDHGLTDKDVLFIEEIIRGMDESERKGRGSEKFFLYGAFFLPLPHSM
jgi:deoxynucleoside triphosphate triphosphohydrolase SAMHD1